METIHIEFQTKIKDKLIAMLTSFNSDELQIITKDLFLEENKNKLENELSIMEVGTDEYISLEELNHLLEKTIIRHES